jgi:tripeptidyl-peptidase-1
MISGGGFSSYFKRPPYQETAVLNFFLSLGTKYEGQYKCARCRDLTLVLVLPCKLCSESGRGYPDIAAQALGLPMIQNSIPFDVNGVGCSVSVRLSLLSAPFTLHRPFASTQLTDSVQTVAGIISLINDFLLSKGKPTLGFLNPWLYNGGLKGFTDIRWGSNPGCNTPGFTAVEGWDPVRPANLYLFIFDVG